MDVECAERLSRARAFSHLLAPSHAFPRLLKPSQTFSQVRSAASQTFSRLLKPSHTFSQARSAASQTFSRLLTGALNGFELPREGPDAGKCFVAYEEASGAVAAFEAFAEKTSLYISINTIYICYVIYNAAFEALAEKTSLYYYHQYYIYILL